MPVTALRSDRAPLRWWRDGPRRSGRSWSRGLFERLIALTGAAGIALLARGVIRRARAASY